MGSPRRRLGRPGRGGQRAPLVTLAEEHQRLVKEHDVFGVRTFVVGEHAVFVRLMDRPGGDAAMAAAHHRGIVDTITGWPGLNEVKHTRISR